MILLINLDLTAPSGSYDSLFAAIKAQGVWWHYMKSTWIVDTRKTPQLIVEELTPHIRGRGFLLISELHRPYQGLLPKEAWEWLNSRFGN